MEIKENFDNIIKGNESLIKLLKGKEINVLTDFSKEVYEPEFKDYISDMYYDSFKEIVKKYIDTEQEGRLTSLLRSVEFLASQKTKDLIANDLQVILESSLNRLCELKNSLAETKKLLTVISNNFNPLSFVVVNIINRFNDYKNIKEYGDKIKECSLDICDAVSKANPKSETVKYAIYNVIINRLEKVKDFGSLRERFSLHKKKITQKRTGVEVKYWIWVVVIILLMLIRLSARVFR